METENPAQIELFGGDDSVSNEDQASKRKSPDQDANSGEDEPSGSSQNKRIKPEESTSGVSIKTEPNPDAPVAVKAEPVDDEVAGAEAEPAAAASSRDQGTSR